MGMKLLSAAFVILLMAFIGLSTAFAQQEGTLRVSNLHQPTDGSISIRGNQQWAQPFCTGSAATTLSKVRMFTAFIDRNLGDTPATDTSASPVVTIRADNSGIPGTVLHTLSNPALDADLDIAEDFTNDGYALSAYTRYWLAVEMPERSPLVRFLISVTVSTAQDLETEPGWAIGKRALFNDYGYWREHLPVNMRMAVYAGEDTPASKAPVSPDRDCAEEVAPNRLTVE